MFGVVCEVTWFSFQCLYKQKNEKKKAGKEVNKYSWNYINIQMAWNIYGDSFWFMQFVFKNV